MASLRARFTLSEGNGAQEGTPQRQVWCFARQSGTRNGVPYCAADRATTDDSVIHMLFVHGAAEDLDAASSVRAFNDISRSNPQLQQSTQFKALLL